jgi:hypothetical protein
MPYHLLTLLVLCMNLAAAADAAADNTRYYTFSIGGAHCGYYREEQTADRLVSHARFRMEEHVIDAFFEYRLVGGKVTAFRLDPDDAFIDVPADHVPTGGVLLLVPQVQQVTTINVVKEGDLTKRWPVELRRDGDHVTEFRGEKKGREFWLKDGVIVRMNWGGDALSELKANKAEAMAGLVGLE